MTQYSPDIALYSEKSCIYIGKETLILGEQPEGIVFSSFFSPITRWSLVFSTQRLEAINGFVQESSL